MWYIILAILFAVTMLTCARWRRLHGEVGQVIVSEMSKIFVVSQTDKGGDANVPFAIFELRPYDFPGVRIATGQILEISYLSVRGSLMVRRWAVLKVRQGAPPKFKPAKANL